ncbi:MAG: SpaA isopeptide-forming pilin-related protein, partial [Oscillospiraceae bacterium]|nr:SpaA isopeptide-forming pilin-related protein [Oscillospiraceae bacterium]
DDEETRVDIEELFGNQMTCSDSRHASAIMELSRTEILNISNVPIETEYTIQEIQETGYDLISIVKEIRNGTVAETRTRVNDLSTGTISGTIVPDRDNHIIFTNKIYSVDITVEKLDENRLPMTGAVFTLEKERSGDETEDTIYTKPDEGESDIGVYKFTDLPDGNYTLYETPPSGYASIGGVTFIVDHGVVNVNSPLPAGVTWNGEEFKFTVVNTPLDNPGSITVRKQWLDFFGNAMSYDETLDLKLVQWAPEDLPEHTVRVYLRCTGNGNGGGDTLQITNIAERSWTGSHEDVLFSWDWNNTTGIKADGGDAVILVEVPEGVGYEAYATTEGVSYNVNGGVPKGKRQYVKFTGITSNAVIYITIRNNRYSGINNAGTNVHQIRPVDSTPVYGPLVPTGGTKTVTLGTGGTWIQSFNISGNGLLSDSSTTLPATYTQNGKTKPCYYTISEEDIPPGYDLEQISTDTVQAGVLAAYNRRNTVDLLVEKVDKQDTAVRLNGATFTLRQIDPEKEGSMDTRTLEGGRTETQTTSGEGSDEGTLTFDSLGEGYYEIKETKAPSNYILSADTAFYIRIVGHQIQLLQKDVHKSAKSWKVIAADYSFISVENATATVFNTTGVALPHTGGLGTRLFMIFGAFLITGAGLLLLRRRRTI